MNIRFYVLYHDGECNYQIDWWWFTIGFHQMSDIRGKSRSWAKKLIFKNISGVCFSVQNRCRFFKNTSQRGHFLFGYIFFRAHRLLESRPFSPRTTPCLQRRSAMWNRFLQEIRKSRACCIFAPENVCFIIFILAKHIVFFFICVVCNVACSLRKNDLMRRSMSITNDPSFSCFVFFFFCYIIS